jgi:hypothetical protein
LDEVALPKISVYRSYFYMPPTGSQNIIWPEIPNYNNPIVGIIFVDELGFPEFKRFNFILKNRQESHLNFECGNTPIKKVTFDPDQIQSVLIRYDKDNALV